VDADEPRETLPCCKDILLLRIEDNILKSHKQSDSNVIDGMLSCQKYLHILQGMPQELFP
jgi:hypothetical protein